MTIWVVSGPSFFVFVGMLVEEGVEEGREGLTAVPKSDFDADF